MPNNLVAGSQIRSQLVSRFQKAAGVVGTVGSDTFTVGATAAPALTVANTGLVQTLSIAASGNATLDLGSFTDPIGDAITTATRAVYLSLVNTSAVADVRLEPGATNPLVWYFAGTTPTVTVKAGGFTQHYDPAGTTISGSAKTLRIVNLSSTLAATVTVCVLVLAT